MKSESDKVPTICIVGAGFSGLCAAIQLQKQLGIKSFTIFESHEDVGGTWLVNKYPGCACDIQSHLYSFSFEKNPYWSSTYSPQPEIWKYIQNIAQKYDIYSSIKFKTDVKVMRWDEIIKKWRVSIEDRSGRETRSQELLFDILISCVGALRTPNVPEQFKTFKGTMFHTAEWNTDISLQNKTVAIIGSGASAVQIIPSIVDQVKTLHVYQRNPPWIIEKTQVKFPWIVQLLFAFIPLLMSLYRGAIFVLNEILLNTFYQGTWLAKMAVKEATKYRNKILGHNPKLKTQLTPSYAFGCKRVLVSHNYYQAMNRSNVCLHTEHIQSLTENSIITKDGDEQQIDVLVLATGFKVQDYFAPLEIYGKDGVNILQLWKEKGPTSYYGILGSCAPNMFVLLGPNTGLGHSTVLFQIECQANFTISVIKELMARNAKTVTVRPESEERFMALVKKGLKRTVWGNEDCGSWYADARGEITTLWPESCTSYWKHTRTVDFNDFRFD